MNGEILYFDTERGVGFISGSDGNRYVFDGAELIGGTQIAKGAKVAFAIDGDRARAIQPLAVRGRRATAVASVAGDTESAVADIAVTEEIQEPGSSRGLFAHFRRCLTSRYANFRDRAPRKEYWGFVLFSMITGAIVAFASFAIDSAMGNADEPVLLLVALVLYALALIVPGLSVTVRRIHDIGLSGWFILLNFVPSVGSLIIFVFTLIPSQKHPNKWGPVPAGIRI